MSMNATFAILSVANLSTGFQNYSRQGRSMGLRKNEMDNYVCVGCGLVESYIADSARLEDVAKLWEKVEPGTDHEK
jgi:hypothetical protein